MGEIPEQLEASMKINLLSITGLEFCSQSVFQTLKKEKKTMLVWIICRADGGRTGRGYSEAFLPSRTPAAVAQAWASENREHELP